MAKWKNFSFRSTPGGNSTWTGGAIVDPQDATQETYVILPSTMYDANTKTASGSQYGRAGGYTTTPGASNVTPTNAGQNPLLGGYHTPGNNHHYQFDMPVGTYEVRLALGASAVATVGFVFEGTVERVLSDGAYPSSNGLRIWNAGGNRVVGDMIVSTIDKGVWKAITAGTSGTTQPSGPIGSANFTDGAVVWQRIARDALLIMNNSPTSNSSVIDQNNAVGPAGGTTNPWSGKTPVTVTVTGDYGPALCLMKPQSVSYPRQFSYRATPYNLSGITVTDEVETDMGTTPTIYAGEPSGIPVLKVNTTSGTNTASAFTLGGAMASYYTPVLIGPSLWLVTNGTRIPDSLAGSRTLTVTQTDADSTNGSFTTTLNCTVVSSQGRATTGVLGQITTKTWLQRKIVKDATDGGWAGYTGQTIAANNDFTANSDAAIRDVMESIDPDGTSWYRIRVQNGVYQTSNTSFGTPNANKNYASNGGGLLIEADTGHTPKLEGQWTQFHSSGVHIRNLTFSPGNGYKSIVNTGPRNSAPFLKLKVTNCNIGSLFTRPGSAASSWGGFIEEYFHDTIHIEYCRINGVENFLLAVGRLTTIRWNQYTNVYKDYHAISPAFYNDSPRGVFTDNNGNIVDNNTYVEISDCTAWKNPDAYTGLIESVTPHSDWIQHRRLLGNAYGYAPGPNNNQNGGWRVNDKVINKAEGTIYIVKSVDANTAAAADVVAVPVLAGRLSSIRSGDVVFGYWDELITPVNFRVLLENNVLLQQGDTVNAQSKPQTPNVQFVIDSNSPAGNPFYVTAINNICASMNVRGIGGGSYINAEFNTFAGPGKCPVVPDTPGITGSAANTVGAYIRAYRNIVGTTGVNPEINGVEAQTVWSYGNVPINWTNTSATIGKANEALTGPFTTYTIPGSPPTTCWGYATTKDTVGTPFIDFIFELSKTLHHKAGLAGGRAYEQYTLTITDATGVSVNKTVYVNR